jgi:hypothetical protein
MNEVLANSPSGVQAAAATIAKGEVVSDEDADAVVDALAAAMLVSPSFEGDELTGRGIEIDGLIGVVQQMSGALLRLEPLRGHSGTLAQVRVLYPGRLVDTSCRWSLIAKARRTSSVWRFRCCCDLGEYLSRSAVSCFGRSC